MKISPRPLVLLLLASLAVTACASDEGAVRAPAPARSERAERPDPHSYALPAQARVQHVSLDLDVDFEARALFGTATLDFTRAEGANALVLDTRALEVESVTDEGGAPLAFRYEGSSPLLGQALVISLAETTQRVVVRYRTGEGADALQWLAPSLTAGGKEPYLFTQGQAILTRTWIPLQDSPGIRITYDATVRVPAALRAIMSAEQQTPEGELEGDKRSFRFEMREKIPPYLIALAVGDLAFRELGPRTGVYSEPSVVDAAAREFSDVESMMTTVEALYGPYRWGRYDILVLPPSFPFGGMENPRLTFLSPTVIAGDKSLVSVVAHELAHSWSGNLVTNSTWRDFWLNEGFTTYIENRILEEVYGEKRAKLVEAMGRRDLMEELEELGPASNATRMCRDLDAEDPDDSINSIPYDKGSAFLRMLENAYGRARFDGFLRRYFDENAFASMTSERFLQRLHDELGEDPELQASLQLDAWVYGVGLPDNAPAVSSQALSDVERAAAAFAGEASLTSAVTADYSALEWVLFLRSLPRSLPAAKLAELDEARGLSRSMNSEIRFEWLKLCVANRYEPALTSLEDFLLTQGRRRLVKPLYESLTQSAWGMPKAREIYQKARGRYHPLTVETLDALFKKAEASAG